MQNAVEIANGSVEYAENESNLKQIARKQLISNLVLAQIDPAFNDDILHFINNNKQSILGSFFLVDNLINSCDSSNMLLAELLNSTLVTTNDVDATQQQFNSEYISYIKSGYNEKLFNTSAFETIAFLCPMIYGQSVYQARTVLFNITKKQYINVCEKGDNFSQRFVNSTFKPSDINVKIFPNPSNGDITLQTNDDLSYQVTIYNLLGEKVFEKQISHNQSINLNYLSSATYILQIKQNDNLIKTERISIIH